MACSQNAVRVAKPCSSACALATYWLPCHAVRACNSASTRRLPSRAASMGVTNSLLGDLEVAGELYRSERYAAACAAYAKARDRALSLAPDLWLCATYGYGDCLRLLKQFDKSATAFQEVVTAGTARPPRD